MARLVATSANGEAPRELLYDGKLVDCRSPAPLFGTQAVADLSADEWRCHLRIFESACKRKWRFTWTTFEVRCELLLVYSGEPICQPLAIRFEADFSDADSRRAIAETMKYKVLHKLQTNAFTSVSVRLAEELAARLDLSAPHTFYSATRVAVPHERPRCSTLVFRGEYTGRFSSDVKTTGGLWLWGWKHRLALSYCPHSKRPLRWGVIAYRNHRRRTQTDRPEVDESEMRKRKMPFFSATELSDGDRCTIKAGDVEKNAIEKIAGRCTAQGPEAKSCYALRVEHNCRCYFNIDADTPPLTQLFLRENYQHSSCSDSRTRSFWATFESAEDAANFVGELKVLEKILSEPDRFAAAVEDVMRADPEAGEEECLSNILDAVCNTSDWEPLALFLDDDDPADIREVEDDEATVAVVREVLENRRKDASGKSFRDPITFRLGLKAVASGTEESQKEGEQEVRA
ncbi:unnamed protein product [Amoebophrya sp. A120]|nr:unnamed protein product [Amoebophrya sp. A120]|eukprot:GSA120T00001851001.1